MTELHGIGNFDGKPRIGGHRHNEVPRREEPFVLNGNGAPDYSRPMIREDGPVAQIACRLLCRDGAWPGWFVWAVGDPVPRRFQQEASRIAMLMGTGRALPPIFQRADVATVPTATAAPRHRTTSSLPPHVCYGGEKTIFALGPVAPDMSIVCSARRTFTVTEVGGKSVFQAVDAPGCGKRFVLDKHGNRVEVA